MKRLLLAGPDSIHLHNFCVLIQAVFDEVKIITNAGSEAEYPAPHLTINPSFRNPFLVPHTLKLLRNAIRDFQPDIIHVHQADTLALLMLLANRPNPVPVVVTAWGSDVLINPQKSWLHKRMLRYILTHASALTADADTVARKMKSLVSSSPEVSVCGFGIEIPRESREKENMIYSNRLHKKLYRIDAILKAFAMFIENRQEVWKLVIAGTGEETENLKALADKSGISEYLSFTGWIGKEENLDYYLRSRFFISIPESDATSVSLLEAMACGCIPLVSDLPANKEWITHGINGWVVSNPEEDFISPALQLRTGEVALANHQLISQKASKEVARNIFSSIYNSLQNNSNEQP